MGSGNNQIRVTEDCISHFEPRIVYSMQGGGYSSVGGRGNVNRGRYGGSPAENDVLPHGQIQMVQNGRPHAIINTAHMSGYNQLVHNANRGGHTTGNIKIIPVNKSSSSGPVSRPQHVVKNDLPQPSHQPHIISQQYQPVMQVSPQSSQPLQLPEKVPQPRPVEVLMFDRSGPNPLVEVVKDFKKWGITVTDPLEKRKVACPFFKISPTNGLLDSSSKAHTHSICILYQNGRCKVEQNCNQIHVDRMYYSIQRLGAPCCAIHHDLFTSSLLSAGVVRLPHVILVTTYKGRRQPYIWPGELISLSLGLSHCPVKVVDGHDTIVVDDSRVCQVWQGSRCTYGKECNYVHMCRAAYANLPRDVQQRQQKYRPAITSPPVQPSVISHVQHSSANSSSGSSSCDGSKHGSPPSQTLVTQPLWPVNALRDSKEDLLLSQCDPHHSRDDSPVLVQTDDVEGILSNFANLFSGSQAPPSPDKPQS